jgi:hypothetical protein
MTSHGLRFLGALTDDITDSYGIAFDSSGNTPAATFAVTAALGSTVGYKNVLFVSERGNNKIDLFVPPFSNGMSPSGALTDELNCTFGLAVAPHT